MAISITFHHLLWPLLFSEPGRWQEHMCSRVQGTPDVLGTAANTACKVLFNLWHFQGEAHQLWNFVLLYRGCFFLFLLFIQSGQGLGKNSNLPEVT